MVPIHAPLYVKYIYIETGARAEWSKQWWGEKYGRISRQ